MRKWKPIIVLLLVSAFSAAGHSRSKQQSPTVTGNLVEKAREARSVVGQAKAAALKIGSDFERGLVLDQIGEAEAKTGDLEAAVVTAISPTRTRTPRLRQSESSLPTRVIQSKPDSLGRH